MVSNVSVVCDVRTKVGESPVWSGREQALYWVDIEGRQVHRFAWSSRIVSTWNVPERVGCIALSARGTVIAAMETGIFEFAVDDPSNPVLHRLASIVHPKPDMRFNDGRCDAKGRFWIGTMCRDMSLASTSGGIYCLDENGLRGPELSGYITPNGMAFSADGLTAYLSDSHPQVQKIWRHSFDLEGGRWGDQFQWVDMKSLPGRPDGAAMDADGCYWICANDVGMVHRFSPDGELLKSVTLPVSKPSMCAFGGPNLDKLFVASIKPAAAVDGFDPALEGALLMVDPDAKGLPEPLFSQFPR
jgi:sugar lactone lactonase YvrE